MEICILKVAKFKLIHTDIGMNILVKREAFFSKNDYFLF